MSQQYTFYGRILPERVPLTVAFPEFQFRCDEFGLLYSCSLMIKDGQFVMPVTLEQGSADIESFRNQVIDVLEKRLNLISYLHGTPFAADVLSVAMPSNQWFFFETGIPGLKQKRQPSQHAIEERLLRAVEAEIAPGSIVLRDFRLAMTSPVTTGFYCYRAIEAMMQSMRTTDQKPDDSWQAFRAGLRISRATILSVKNHADAPRHGKPSFLTSDERADIFNITDEIIRRYLEYLLRSKSPLPPEEFPELTAEVRPRNP
ncbi:MAG TPA: hypothetical protein VJX30_12505 [Terriglobales bacterium]|nr:hypothetical protein [Terriglobales bacterium]